MGAGAGAGAGKVVYAHYVPTNRVSNATESEVRLKH